MALIENTEALRELLLLVNNLPVVEEDSPTPELNIQLNKTITPTKSIQVVEPDIDYDALSQVTVNAIPDEYIIPSGNKEITANENDIDVKQYATVSVNVPASGINTDDATVTASDILYPKTAYAKGVKVTGNIQTKSNTDVTVTGDTITIPSGYYGSQVTKSVASGSLSDISVSASGLITASVGTAGYIATGTSTQKTKQLSTVGATTITPSTSEQIAVNSGVYTTGIIKVAPISASTIDNTIINGASNVNSTGSSIDSFTVSVDVPEGFHAEQTLTKTFSNILPELESDATDEFILNGYQAYSDQGIQITGTMTNNGQVTRTLNGTTTSYTIPKGYHDGTGTVSHSTVNIPDPTITISSSGLITASGSWTAGFTTDTSYSNTSQLTTKAATTITPSTSQQTAISSGTYATGNIIVNPIPSNYITTTDATATSSDIINGQTAYVNGSKVTGNLVVQKYYTGSSAPSSSFGNNGDLYLVV